MEVAIQEFEITIDSKIKKYFTNRYVSTPF